MNNKSCQERLLPAYILEAIEQSWGVRLPVAYKLFLEQNNGEELENSKVFEVDGEGWKNVVVDEFFWVLPCGYSNLLKQKKDFKHRIPSNMLPIARDPFGNLILIAVKMADYGKIYFWDHDREAEDGEKPTYENLTLIADSFDEFINNLKDMKEMGG